MKKAANGFYLIRQTDNGKITRHLSDEHLNLSRLMEEFEFFLKGCGYYFDGEIDLVETEEEGKHEA